MRRILPIAFALTLLVLGSQAFGQSLDVNRHFAGFDGCFVLYDLHTGAATRFNAQLSALPGPSAGAFEIFDALVGLQTGILKDENTNFPWDGTPQPVEAWAKDQTLASAMQSSVTWYFQDVVDQVGPGRMQYWLNAVGLGNRFLPVGNSKLWSNPGSMKISVDDQVAFLVRLYKKRLPFDQRAMDLVRRLLVLREENGATFSGMAASDAWADTTFGSFVGHLRTADGDEYVVATNIRGKAGADGEKARAITEAIFNDMGLLTSTVAKKKGR
jgi:bla regulator protein BlaR1